MLGTTQTFPEIRSRGMSGKTPAKNNFSMFHCSGQDHGDPPKNPCMGTFSTKPYSHPQFPKHETANFVSFTHTNAPHMCQDQLVALLEASVEWMVSLIPSGQIIATLHDLTPNGGLVGEIRLFQGKSIALRRIL